MNILSIIENKRNKKELTKKEIEYFITNYLNGIIPDYQASALLMAICLNGMTEKETFNLCDAMINSGEVLDLSYVKGVCVDKHSSGGVSDTTSIALIPILACANLYSAKMSGKGIGFTGGTIDKLESFSGINLERSEDEIRDILNKCGCLIVKQTKNLVPADKKLYALRDITGTIESIPLIATSIMSKKIASDNSIIMLDVKVGDGAFMKNINDAKKLANLMIKIGSRYKKKVAVVISQMIEPLGDGIGCYLEILDAINVLNGKKGMLYELVKFMAINLMVLSGKYTSIQAEETFNNIIETKKGYQKFLEMIKCLGGNIKDIKKMEKYARTPTSKFISSEKCYIKNIKCKNLGILVSDMGGGRQEIDDKIDYSVGIQLLKHIGDEVKPNETIAEIFNTNKKLDESEVYNRLVDCFVLSNEPTKKTKIIKYYFHN